MRVDAWSGWPEGLGPGQGDLTPPTLPSSTGIPRRVTPGLRLPPAHTWAIWLGGSAGGHPPCPEGGRAILASTPGLCSGVVVLGTSPVPPPDPRTQLLRTPFPDLGASRQKLLTLPGTGRHICAHVLLLNTLTLACGFSPRQPCAWEAKGPVSPVLLGPAWAALGSCRRPAGSGKGLVLVADPVSRESINTLAAWLLQGSPCSQTPSPRPAAAAAHPAPIFSWSPRLLGGHSPAHQAQGSLGRRSLNMGGTELWVPLCAGVELPAPGLP